MSSKNKGVLIFIAVLAILICIAILLSNIYYRSSQAGLNVYTDKKEYGIENGMKIGIKNNANSVSCFSSCYPFEIEMKTGSDWTKIPAIPCEASNVAQICIKPGEKKAFGTDLSLTNGIYRFVINTCGNCKEGDNFTAEKSFASNEFQIK